MRHLFIITLCAASLFGVACKGYYQLGDTISKEFQDISSIVWHKKGSHFILDSNQCYDEGFVLVHDNDKKYPTKKVSQKSFTLKKGWNYINAPKEGIDVIQTFTNNKSIQFVYIYDPKTPAWAGFSPHEKVQELMQNVRILDLYYIEPEQGFYIYADEKTTINTIATKMNKSCKALLNSGDFNILTHSALHSDSAKSNDEAIMFHSLYQSHYRRGVYNDTRVTLLYPKNIKNDKSLKMLQYGPIEPRALITYNQAFEDKTFYIFDYFEKECYKGLFPSKQVPPFPTLRKIK